MRYRTINTYGKSRLNKQTSDAMLGVLPAPQPGKQELFLNCEADVALFGGAAGGGKTLGLLLDAAKAEKVANPDYRAVIFRRLVPSLRAEGGIWDTANRFYGPLKPDKNQSDLKFTFVKQGGGVVRFAGLQYKASVEAWDSSQITYLGFEELDEFEEEQFFYMLSRNRSTSGIRPICRATTNPNADSWLANFIAWWIDEDGFPIDERSGVVRWFLRRNGVVHWGDTKQELIDRFGGDEDLLPLSFTFIPSKLSDNPLLLEADPQYSGRLDQQHPINSARLKLGNWKVTFAAGTIFSAEWFEVVEETPTLDYAHVTRFWDFAGTAHNAATPETSWTVGLKLAKFAHDYYIICDILFCQVKGGDVPELIANVAMLDGLNTRQRWEQEGGSSGVIVAETLATKIFEKNPNIDAQAVTPFGTKLARAIPVATAGSQGHIKIKSGTYVDSFFNAVNNFDGTKKPKINDFIDALSGAYNELHMINIPMFGGTSRVTRKKYL